MLFQVYNIVFDCVVRATGHGKYFVDSLKTTDKRFITMLMKTVQISGAATKDSQMFMNTAISNTSISIARKLKKIFHTQHMHMA